MARRLLVRTSMLSRTAHAANGSVADEPLDSRNPTGTLSARPSRDARLGRLLRLHEGVYGASRNTCFAPLVHGRR